MNWLNNTMFHIEKWNTLMIVDMDVQILNQYTKELERQNRTISMVDRVSVYDGEERYDEISKDNVRSM